MPSVKMLQIIKKANKEFSRSHTDIAEKGMRHTVHYSTGSKMIDLAVSSNNGGIPEGKIIEIYGPESAGKSTFSIIAIATRQRIERERAEHEEGYEPKSCIFVDAEGGFDKELAAQYGVDLTELVYIDPDTAEHAIDILDGLIRTGDVALAVVDSVPALTPSKVEESSMSQQTMGLVARLMSQACTKLNGSIRQYGTSIIFINQIREKVGVMYGNPETTPGGRALKFYSWLRIKITRGEDIKNGDEVIGHQMKVQMVKNKSDAPKKVATTDLYYTVGYSVEKEIIDLCKLAGIIQGTSWLSVIDPETGEVFNVNGIDLKFNGKAKMIAALQENPDIFNFLQNLLDNFTIEAEEEEISPDDDYAREE